MSPRIRLLHQLGRSGGTLISRCLGSMRGVVLLSEIHPFTPFIRDDLKCRIQRQDPLYQAAQWFGLIDEHDYVSILAEDGSVRFAEIIRLIERKARETGSSLVIRNWAHLDYAARPFLEEPTYQLSLVAELQADFDILQTATVRHPVDQYLSFQRMRLLRGIGAGEYLSGYRRFAEQCLEIGFTRFEDFCADPDWHLLRLCEQLDVAFDPDYRTRWLDYETITGDRVTKRVIKPVRRKHAPSEVMDQLRRCPDYRPLMEMLGYAP